MAKSSRFKHEYRSNASKLHKGVGDIVRSHALLKNYKAYQEYVKTIKKEIYKRR